MYTKNISRTGTTNKTRKSLILEVFSQAYGAVYLLQVEASCIVIGVQNSGVNMLLLMICLPVVQLWMKHKICSVLPFELQSIVLLIVLKDLNY